MPTAVSVNLVQPVGFPCLAYLVPLLDEHRLSVLVLILPLLLQHIARKAAEMRAVTSKALDAIVTSAVPLTKEQQASVAKALPAYAPAGSNLTVSYAVDPAILGGLLVTIKNQTIDLSAASRLVEVVSGGRAMA